MEKYKMRFAEKTLKTKECWFWQGTVTPKNYGSFWDGTSMRRAHRVAYEYEYGEIPQGTEIDHTCHKAEECSGGNTCIHRRCVNPAHLEAVTHQENCKRGVGSKTHCKQGHEFTPENTFYYGVKNQRACRKCFNQRSREYRARNWLPPKPREVKTTCKLGHPYAGDNLYINRLGFKECRICRQTSRLRYQEKMKAT